MLLSAEQITKSYGARILLDQVSVYLSRGQKIGVIGVNGTGKSTMLRILAGAEEPEGGSVTRDPNVRLDYLPQNPPIDKDCTVLEQMFRGLSAEARELAEYEAKNILTRLEITQFDQPIRELSGGQRKRVALASSLVHESDILILDEPTNHLDVVMVRWLEDTLRRYTGALVMVTHDRYFLERVVNQIAELDQGKLYLYEGSYTSFLQQKTQREERVSATERKRQSILRREYQWVMQGAKGRGTKSRERLERYTTLSGQESPAEKSAVELSALSGLSSRLGKKIIELRGVTKSFGDRAVVRDFDCLLLRDDRIGIVGTNGSGKTTLLNLIAGRLAPDAGTCTVGETVAIGYFCQENPEIDPQQRVIDYVKTFGNRIETAEGAITASQLLEKFLFPDDAQWSPVSKLSGGEKRRLFLLAVLAAAPNVLLLDEPTNDLDIQTLAILEDYLDTFPGAVIAVSHDRYFLDRVVRRVFAVEEDGEVTPCAGGYGAYLESLETREKAGKSKEAGSIKTARSVLPKKLKFSFKEQREYETIDDDITALEKAIAQTKREQETMADDYVALQQLQERQLLQETDLEEKVERWVYLTGLAEQIESQL